jgi:hypothetical protein
MMSIKLAARTSFVAVVLGMGLAMASPAQADVRVGLLNCRSAQTSSYVVVSNQPLTCVFTPSNGAPAEYYQADVSRFGAQAGFNSNVEMGWAVFAPTLQLGPGALSGVYGGVSAGAAFGVGVGANGLVGGNNNSLALQPVSVEGQTGFNVVATVTRVDLQAVMPVRHYRHHPHH